MDKRQVLGSLDLQIKKKKLRSTEILKTISENIIKQKTKMETCKIIDGPEYTQNNCKIGNR